MKTHCKRGHERTPENVGKQGQCKKCESLRSRSPYNRRYYLANLERLKEKDRKYYRSHKEQKLATYRKRKLPLPTRPCPAVCEVCGRKGKHALSLDHDHTTGKFRGWLCNLCNSGIGKLGDSIEGLERALQWLKTNTL